MFGRDRVAVVVIVEVVLCEVRDINTKVPISTKE